MRSQPRRRSRPPARPPTRAAPAARCSCTAPPAGPPTGAQGARRRRRGARPRQQTRTLRLRPVKRYLFTPGPTPVPPEVLAAVGAPVVHHRSPDFLPVYERVLTRLREVYRTENDVLLFGASGTGAFESAVANLVSPGEPHLVVSGSQKALMSPPGLGLAAVSEAALGATGSSPRFYFDWERTRKAQETLDAPVTLPVSLVAGLDVALELLFDEGLEAAFERHVRLGRAARAGVKSPGLELFSPDEDRSAVVTAARAPAGVDSGDVLRGVRARFGITLA